MLSRAKIKIKPRYYRVPRYFFTVLTVEQNQWYRATLRGWGRGGGVTAGVSVTHNDYEAFFGGCG